MQLKIDDIIDIVLAANRSRDEGFEAAYEKYKELTAQQQKDPDSVEVRIAVAIDSKGKWYAVGWQGFDDGDIVCAYDGLDSSVDGQAIRYVTALIPRIETPEVSGEVEART